MRLSDLDPEFMRRLENWGLCYRKQYRPAESSIYRVCQHIAGARGSRPKDDYRESNPKPDLDIQDAILIEGFITSGGINILDRRLIIAYFAQNEDPRRTCRTLDVTIGAWESLLCIAIVSLKSIVDTSEKWV